MENNIFVHEMKHKIFFDVGTIAPKKDVEKEVNWKKMYLYILLVKFTKNARYAENHEELITFYFECILIRGGHKSNLESLQDQGYVQLL